MRYGAREHDVVPEAVPGYEAIEIRTRRTVTDEEEPRPEIG
jgi:hypothetical protein